LYFAGTGYLGLQGHPEVIAAAQEAVAKIGVHSATSRNGFGMTAEVVEVERRAAEFFGTEHSLYLVSGYAGNFAIAAALSPAVDLVLIDETAHDCLREAVRCFDRLKQPPLVFRHRDAGHVAALLREHVRPGMRPLLMTDGVFPMSGKLSPLADYLASLRKYGHAMLLVDDAHGIAAMGEQGRGSLELAGVVADQINRDLEEKVDGPRVFLSATLSKAIGGHGGILAGSRAFLERVRKSSGWFRGASAPAAAVAGATAKALEIVQTNPELRQRLAENVRQVREGLRSLGLAVDESPSPVIGLSWDAPDMAERLRNQLLDRGIALGFSREYTGSSPHGTLRIAIFASHTPPMIEKLLAAIREELTSIERAD
jgi:7-keto-8-aminopelargonate synthetase-like enzyme